MATPQAGSPSRLDPTRHNWPGDVGSGDDSRSAPRPAGHAVPTRAFNAVARSGYADGPPVRPRTDQSRGAAAMTSMRLGLIAVLTASLGSIPPASRADGPPAGEERDPVAAARPDERPPRKVIIGTVIFGPYGSYPGLERRLEVLGDLIDRMARQAAEQYPGRRLDLAILPETTVTSTHGKAQERAVPLRGRVREAFGALARKHRTYIIAPMDLAEDGRGGTSCSNAAVLFDRKGEVAGIYRSVHPVAYVGHDDLEGGIEPGADCPVFDCDFGRLGIQICWDIQYPNGWDALARGGAEIVAWPTASPATVLAASNAARHRYYVGLEHLEGQRHGL